MSSEQALLGHVVSQIETNIQFLISQNYLTQADASAFLSKLSSVGGGNRPPVSAPAKSLPKAKALWAYNGDADDLSFAAGDIIEIVEETNADWWTGRINGRQALFPSAYVERVKEQPVPAAAAAKPAYKPFRAAYSGVTSPPPPGTGTNAVGLQQDPGQEAKKNKYGKYGDTMATSAASGVGFGAGAAIGGGLVRAIF